MKNLFLAIVLFSTPLQAQTAVPPAEDPIHQQLRETRKEIIAAIEARDLNRMLAHVHPDVVVTWQNAETTHGVAELRTFYDRMGKDSFVSFKVPHQPDQLSILHGGDTAISAGHVVANYKLLGKDYEFTSRWTATLVLKDGKWLLAAYHISLNALDNPILSTAKSLLGVAAFIGFLFGVGLLLLLKKIRRTPAID